MSAFQKLPKRFHPDFRVPGKKPVGPVEINDPGILEAYALSNAATALNLRDMVGGGMVSPSGVEVALSSGPNGKFLAVRSGRYYDVSSLRLRNLVGGGNPFAVLFDICPQQEDVNGAAWGFGGSDDLIFYPSGGSGRIRVFWRKVGGNIIDVNVPDNIVGQRNQYIFTSNGVDDHRMYFNGRLVDSSTSNGVAGPFSSGPYLCAWAENPSSQNLDLDLYGYVVLDRLVSEAEAKALHKDLKGQLLKPANDYGYFTPSNGGSGVPILSILNSMNASASAIAGMSQAHVMGVEDTQQTSQSDQVTTAQALLVSFEDTLSSGVSEAAAMFQAFVLGLEDSLTSMASASVGLTTAHILQAVESLSSQTSATVFTGLSSFLEALNTRTAQGSEVTGSSTTSILTAEGTQTQSASDSAVATGFGYASLVVENTSTDGNSGKVVILQDGMLVPVGTISVGASEEIEIFIASTLAIVDTTQGSESATIELAQDAVLMVNGLTTQHATQTVSLFQNLNVTAIDSIQQQGSATVIANINTLAPVGSGLTQEQHDMLAAIFNAVSGAGVKVLTQDLHTALDSYSNKDNWSADSEDIADAVWNKTLR